MAFSRKSCPQNLHSLERDFISRKETLAREIDCLRKIEKKQKHKGQQISEFQNVKAHGIYQSGRNNDKKNNFKGGANNREKKNTQ